MHALFMRQPDCTRAAGTMLGLALMTLSLWGCESSESNAPMATTADQTPVVAPLEHPLLKGIPIPTGFKIVPERSRARHSGATRVAQCEFQGSLAPGEVVRFYEHYMPTVRFRLGPKVFVNGDYTLRFVSDSEECDVFIKPKGFNTTLILDVGPLWKGDTDQPARPTPPPP